MVNAKNDGGPKKDADRRDSGSKKPEHKPGAQRPSGRPRHGGDKKRGGGRDRRPARPTGPMTAASLGVSARTVEHMRSKNVRREPIEVQGNPPKLKIYALGGLEEIGRNCTVFECGDDIVIIDAGLMFPEEGMPGIDYIVPNVTSLKGKEKNIRGLIVSHGHMDHVGGIPHLMEKLGWPTIYTAPLTAGIIRNRQKEHGNERKLRIQLIDADSRVQMGRNFVFEPFHVNHNISDAFGTALYTPYGLILGTGDFKFDFSPAGDEEAADLMHIASYGAKNVLLLMSDSTNATLPGHQISERKVGEDLERAIAFAPKRIILGTFSSMLTRLQQIIDIAERHNRKILLQGRSLLNNVELAHSLGYMRYNKGTIVEEGEFRRLPDEKIIVVCTGAQGEKNAALMKIASKEHRVISIKPEDTVIFSSSVIPGNERSVQSLKDVLVRQGAKIIDNVLLDVHAGGHAKQEDLKLMLRLTKPQYFMPIHGNRFMLEAHADIAELVGTPRSNIFVADNGQIIEFDKNGGNLTTQTVPTEYCMIDGLGDGDVSEVVIRDRLELAGDGMMVAICTVSKKTGMLVAEPEIITRGFVYLKDSMPLIGKTRDFVKKIMKGHDPKIGALDESIKSKIRNDVGAFLYKETKRRPMVLPVIIEV